MNFKNSAIYLSLALHLIVGIIIYLSLPSVLMPKKHTPKLSSVPIDYITLAESYSPTSAIEDVEKNELGPEDKEETTKDDALEPPIVDADQGQIPIEDKAENSDVSTIVQPIIKNDNKEVQQMDLRDAYIIGLDGKITSLADWVLTGLDKNKYPESSYQFHKRKLIPNLIEPGQFLMRNPLSGSGDLPDVMPKVTKYSLRVNKPLSQSLIGSRHKRRKEGAYTGGIYSMSPLSDPQGVGVGLIAYEANISNCAHEEARTGVNRCRMRDRWIDQKVAEYLKEQEKQ